MERAPNPWDRFYRYHKDPWRGERELADLAEFLADPVLELGAGNGKALRPLRRAGHHVVPLDISWNALRRLGEGVLADARWLPFATGSFATVLDLHCTGHLLADGRAGALADAARVLPPGGHLVVERLGRDDLRAANGDEVEHHTRRLDDGRTTHFSDEASLRSDVEAAGFEVIHSITHRRRPRLRGQTVVRSSVQVTGRRAG